MEVRSRSCTFAFHFCVGRGRCSPRLSVVSRGFPHSVPGPIDSSLANARLNSPLTPTLSPTGELEIECRGRGEGDAGGGCGHGVALGADAAGGPVVCDSAADVPEAIRAAQGWLPAQDEPWIRHWFRTRQASPDHRLMIQPNHRQLVDVLGVWVRLTRGWGSVFVFYHA
jgi:hypothetical protein